MSQADESHCVKNETLEESTDLNQFPTFAIKSEPESVSVLRPSFKSVVHDNTDLPMVTVPCSYQEPEAIQVTPYSNETIVKEELIIEDSNVSDCEEYEIEDASDDSRNTDGNKVLFCNECNKSFNQKRSYNSHRLRHSNIKNKKYPCNYCEKPFATRRDLDRHARSVHFASSTRSAVQSINQTRKCPLCPTLCDTNDSYRSHLQTHEQQLQSMFRCEFCSKCFGEQDSLEQHIALRRCEKMPKYDFVEENGRFKCCECNQTFSVKRLCVQHIKRHVAYRNKTFQCGTCGNLYGTNSELMRHARFHGADQTSIKLEPSVPNEGETTNLYRCSECPKTFLDRSGCDRHIRRHETLKNGTFQCSECGKCYGRETELRKHKLAHEKKQAMKSAS